MNAGLGRDAKAAEHFHAALDSSDPDPDRAERVRDELTNAIVAALS